MAGFVEPGIQQQAVTPMPGTNQGPAPAMPVAQAPPMPGPKGKPPEGDEKVDAFIAQGIRLIHDPKISDGIKMQITRSDEPVEAIADQTINVVNSVEGNAKKNGITLNAGELAQAGNILMGEIIDIAERSGSKKLSDEDKYLAFSLAISKYMDQGVKSGKITPDQLQQMATEAKESPDGKKMVAMSDEIMGPSGPKGGA